MKTKFLTLLWIIFVAGTLAGCQNNSNTNEPEPVDEPWDIIIEDITWENDAVISYNDSLVDLASQCIVSEDAVWNVYDNESAWVADIQEAIEKTIDECNTAKENINKLGDWEGDASLKNGVLNIIDKEIAYFWKFSELLPYLEIENPTEEQEEAYNNVFAEIEALDRELEQANESLISLQETFAKNHWFELETEEDIEEIVEEPVE